MEIHAPQVPRRDVGDGTAGQAAVGQHDQFAVRRDDLGLDDIDLGNHTDRTIEIDHVACTEGFEDQQDQSAREILHRAAERHADGHAARSQQGRDGTGVDAQGADHDGDQNGPQYDLEERDDERRHRLLGAPPLERTPQQFGNRGDQPGADDIDGQCGQDLESEFNGFLAQFLDEGAGIGLDPADVIQHFFLEGICRRYDVLYLHNHCFTIFKCSHFDEKTQIGPAGAGESCRNQAK